MAGKPIQLHFTVAEASGAQILKQLQSINSSANSNENIVGLRFHIANEAELSSRLEAVLGGVTSQASARVSAEIMSDVQRRVGAYKQEQAAIHETAQAYEEMAKINPIMRQASSSVEGLTASLRSMKVSDGVFAAVTKGLEEFDFEVTKTKATLNGNVLDIHVSGVDQMGHAVTVVQQYDTALAKLVSSKQSQANAWKDGTASVQEYTMTVGQAFKEVISLQQQLSQQKLVIARTDPSNTAALQEEIRYYDEIEAKLTQLKAAYNDFFTTQQQTQIMSNEEAAVAKIQHIENEIRIARAEAAKPISLAFELGTPIDKLNLLEAKFQQLGNAPDAVILKLQELRAMMEEAALSDDVNVKTAAYKQLEMELSALTAKYQVLAETETVMHTKSAQEETQLNRLALQMDNYAQKYAAGLKRNIELQSEFNALLSQVQSGAISAADAAKSFTAIQVRCRAAGVEVESLTHKIGAIFGSGMIQRIRMISSMAAFRLAYVLWQDVKDLDAAMTELRKVTDETAASYNKFLDTAASRAKEIGATMSDVVKSTADFARLGYNIQDASDLADAALVFKNVGDGLNDIDDASEKIISMVKAFSEYEGNAMSIVDKMNEVGKQYCPAA